MNVKQAEKVGTGLWQASLDYYERAKRVLPGGVTANIKYFEPHPIVMEGANGSKLYDVDGNEYIDYLLCYGALILGHGHPKVNRAVQQQIIAYGTSVFGAPHRLELEMAERLVRLFPSMDMVRYTNSGMEATLLAVRAAEAYTGKRKIAKFEGHYHGGYNQVLLSVSPDREAAGRAESPNAVPDSKGISDFERENTIVLPFNDSKATEALLRKHADELAAVILEPVQGGFIPADEAFIHTLRDLTEELGILLIFDEVKTGFRLTLGGAQTIYGVEPDLTALGKVIGGGFPFGVVGGRKAIMEEMAPDRGRDILTAGAKRSSEPDILFHSGTYNGHPTVLAAGLATIDVLEQPGTLERLFAMTDELRNRLQEVYDRYSIPMQTLGMGSIFHIVLTHEPVKNYRDMEKANHTLRKRIDQELLKLGVYTKPLNRYSMSVVHSQEDIDRTVRAHEQAIQKVVIAG